MGAIHPLDHELKEARKIVEAFEEEDQPVFIIIENHQITDFNQKVIPIVFSILRNNGIKVTNHSVFAKDFSRAPNQFEKYLKSQNADVVFYPDLLSEKIPEEDFLEISKVAYQLNYSIIAYLSAFDILGDLDLQLNDMGYITKVIKEEHLLGSSLIDPSPQTDESIRYTNIFSIPQCDLEYMDVDISLGQEVCETKFEFLKQKGDGVQEITNEMEFEIAEYFSKLAQREGCWDSPIIDKDLFYKRVLKIYLYVEKGYVRGYAAFNQTAYYEKNNSDKITTWCIADLYTCPEFRNQGISSNLLDYAIQDLGMDKDNLCVIGPVMPAAQKIIAKNSSKNIMISQDDVFLRSEKADIEKRWGI